MTLQAKRIAGDPDTGADGLMTIFELEIAQKLLNIINAGTGGVDQAILELIDGGLLPSAIDTADGIREIWDELNSGILNRRMQTMWIKVEGECCTESRVPLIWDPFYKSYEKWYRCDAAGDIDSTDPQGSLEQILNNFESCKAKAKQAFDCESIMGSRKGF